MYYFSTVNHTVPDEDRSVTVLCCPDVGEGDVVVLELDARLHAVEGLLPTRHSPRLALY